MKQIEVDKNLNSTSVSSATTMNIMVNQDNQEVEKILKDIYIIKLAGNKAFHEFTENTAVHGVPYLGKREYYTFERLFWLLMITGSIYICSGYIQSIWEKWNDTPVIISFSEKSTPIWKFPFPTITICPDAKTNKKIFDYGKIIKDLEKFAFFYNETSEPDWLNNEKTMKYLEATSEICDYNLSKIYNIENRYFEGQFLDIVNSLRFYSEGDNDGNKDEVYYENRLGALYSCWLKSKKINCDEYFDEILTDKGICYVFNFLNASENVFRENVVHEEIISSEGGRTTKWSLDKGYEKDAVNETFPFRTYSPLVEDGLYVLLRNYLKDIDPICGGGSEGYKISFDAPGEIPQVSRHHINIPFNHETLIDITPEMTITQESAITYSPKIRHCYLENERPLYFFKSCSRTNCELECLTNHTFKLCGCVRFFMPRTSDMAICSAGSQQCYQKAKEDVISRDFLRLHVDNPDEVLNCNCFPSCKMLSYTTGVTEAKLRQKDIMSYRSENVSYAEVAIYFKERRFWTSERSKLYGTIEFIAHSGGLMGLFMGISAISCAEILYFFIFRFIHFIRIAYKGN